MEIKNLCKAYGDLPVLENVSFTAGVGVTALWGPSGVGKTTLLRILLGLEKPDSGELMGTDVRWSAVFQEDRLLEGLDALGNLRFALGTDYEEAKAAAMLTALGLTWETGKPVREWSGGMKRRVGIAQALLNEPEVLFLDEPTSGLDPGERVRFRNLLSEFAHDRIVLISTHIVSDVEYIATQNAVMKDGSIIASGTTEQLVQQINGKVWNARIRPEEVARWEQQLCVVSLRNEEDGSISIRYLAEKPEVPQSQNIEPRLEDLYLWLFPNTEREG